MCRIVVTWMALCLFNREGVFRVMVTWLILRPFPSMLHCFHIGSVNREGVFRVMVTWLWLCAFPPPWSIVLLSALSTEKVFLKKYVRLWLGVWFCAFFLSMLHCFRIGSMSVLFHLTRRFLLEQSCAHCYDKVV